MGFAVESSSDGILTLVGELDLATAGQLEAALATSLHAGSEIVLDIARLTFIDAAGLHVLSAAARTLQPGGRLLVRGASPWIRKVMEIVRLQDIPNVQLNGESVAA